MGEVLGEVALGGEEGIGEGDLVRCAVLRHLPCECFPMGCRKWRIEELVQEPDVQKSMDKGRTWLI